jgi:hypothetical protein
MATPYAIIVGANKTGTTSLRHALSMVYGHLHPVNHRKNQKNWDGLKGLYKRHDYEKLLTIACDYSVLKDHPWNLGDMYKRVAKKFPACKVFLTERDPDSWYHSLQKFTNVLYFRENKYAKKKNKLDFAAFKICRKHMLEERYGVKDFDNIDEVKQAYVTRNEEIKTYFEGNPNFTCIRVPEDMNWIAIQKATQIEESIIRNNILTRQHARSILKNKDNNDRIAHYTLNAMLLKNPVVAEKIQPYYIINPQDTIDKWHFPYANRQQKDAIDMSVGLKGEGLEDIEARPD